MLYSLRRLGVLGIFASLALPAASFNAATNIRPASAVLRGSPLRLSEVAPAGAETEADCGCPGDVEGVVAPTKTEGVQMNGEFVTGATLRATELVDTSGTRRSIGSVVGEEGKAVVIFLRHLGWPLCWDYALAWQQQAGRLSRAGVAGPLFVSVGQPEQLKQFLEVNAPELTRALALVDDSPDFAGYKAAGFNLMLGDQTLETPPDFKPPVNMGPGRWFKYLANVGQLSPIPKDMKFGDIPQGVRVLGGTYAVDGDAVTFSHSDEVPGATPDIRDVLAAVGA